MPMTSREMVNYLKKHGFIITSQSGSHIKLFHPITKKKETQICCSIGFLTEKQAKILKEAGLR